jgi:hypothetical protein
MELNKNLLINIEKKDSYLVTLLLRDLIWKI